MEERVPYSEHQERDETHTLAEAVTCSLCGQHLPAGARIPPEGHYGCPKATYREKCIYGSDLSPEQREPALYAGACTGCGAAYSKGTILVPVRGPYGKWVPEQCTCRKGDSS